MKPARSQRWLAPADRRSCSRSVAHVAAATTTPSTGRPPPVDTRRRAPSPSGPLRPPAPPADGHRPRPTRPTAAPGPADERRLAAAGRRPDRRLPGRPSVIQTDWNPEAEHGWLYQMVGDRLHDRPKDGRRSPGRSSPAASTPASSIEIRSGGPAIGFQTVTVAALHRRRHPARLRLHRRGDPELGRVPDRRRS